MFCHAARRFRFVALVCFAIIPLTAGGQGAAEPDAMKVDLAAAGCCGPVGLPTETARSAAASWCSTAASRCPAPSSCPGSGPMLRWRPSSWSSRPTRACWPADSWSAPSTPTPITTSTSTAARRSSCASDANQSWNEIKRVGGLDKPAGQWHEGSWSAAATRSACRSTASCSTRPRTPRWQAAGSASTPARAWST